MLSRSLMPIRQAITPTRFRAGEALHYGWRLRADMLPKRKNIFTRKTSGRYSTSFAAKRALAAWMPRPAFTKAHRIAICGPLKRDEAIRPTDPETLKKQATGLRAILKLPHTHSGKPILTIVMTNISRPTITDGFAALALLGARQFFASPVARVVAFAEAGGCPPEPSFTVESRP